MIKPTIPGNYLQLAKILGIVIMLAQILDMYTTKISLDTGFFREWWFSTVWLVDKAGWGFPNFLKLCVAFGYPFLMIKMMYKFPPKYVLWIFIAVGYATMPPVIMNTIKYMELYRILVPFLPYV